MSLRVTIIDARYRSQHLAARISNLNFLGLFFSGARLTTVDPYRIGSHVSYIIL